MSIDAHSPSVAGFRCEPITTDILASSCVHSRLMSSAEPSDVSRRDDPAVLIGLAFAFVRQGPLLDGLVPETLMLRLRALADGGNAACRLLLDWLRNRNRDFGQSGTVRLTLPMTVTVLADAHRPRRSPRERVLATIPKPGPIDGRRRGRTRPRDPAPNARTAIIAAETGGRIDG
ncbi:MULTISPECIES: hypothetical protein [unclassified Ensifer]|uniref:hypothetical protein n=1 Tax=unclassified Ensifer TaxID=2633371 RepID=UPI0008137F17|nr:MULTISPECIES: hypothetical protein [unclassified Ensifer]OCP21340.1 hypothetical protein BC363_28130 [Ensifer sp. LC384]OCP22373.1 hypothetical protein BC361_24950 [Ensifer sp. LC54]